MSQADPALSVPWGIQLSTHLVSAALLHFPARASIHEYFSSVAQHCLAQRGLLLPFHRTALQPFLFPSFFPLSPARIVLPPKPFTLRYAPLLSQPKPLPPNMPQKLQPLTNDASPLSWLCWNTVASRVGSPCLIPAAVTLLPARLSNKCQNHEPALVGTAEALAQFALPTSVPRWDAGRKKKGTSEEKMGSMVAPFKSLIWWFGAAFQSLKSCKYLSFSPLPSQWLQIKLFTF